MREIWLTDPAQNSPAAGSELAVGIIVIANLKFSLASKFVCPESNEAATGNPGLAACPVLYELE